MIEGKPSRTALMVAAMRAHHNANAPEPKILYDNLAGPLAGFDTDEALSLYIEGLAQTFASLSDRQTAELFLRRVEGSVCMRSRLVEGEIAPALERGLEQLVILGAGLDSTAYRNVPGTEGLDIFEVDYPSTQAWKQERLAAIGIDIPDNISFVAFDFENQTLAEALEAGGVSRDKITLFPWLGVQPYLKPETVEATLSVLAGFAKGSEVVMDFVAPDYAITDDMNEGGVAQLSQVVNSMGEPFLSRYAASGLKALFLETGFSEGRMHTTGELIDRFLDGAESAYSMPKGVITLASAIV